MSYSGDIYKVGNRKIFLTRGIFDYFEKKKLEGF